MWHPRVSQRLGFVPAGLVSLVLAGCGPESNPNRSPTPEQDPARYQEAVRVSEEAKLKSLETEKAMFKNMKMPAPN